MGPRIHILILLFVLHPCFSFASGGEKVSYEMGGSKYEGYFVSPKAGAPLVLLVHDWDGLTDYEVKRAGMMADMGYAVFAADLFGAGVRPTETDEKKRLTGELYGNREKMRLLLKGALDAAAEKGAEIGNAVAVGYCFGGSAVLELARSGAAFKGFVAFHGGLKTPENQDYSKTKGELLVFHGSADSSVSLDDFAALASELEAAGIVHEMTTYSGAPHAFTVFGSDPYREDADRKSWERFSGFLRRLLR